MQFLVFLQTKRAWVQQKPSNDWQSRVSFFLLNKWFLLPLQSPSLLKYQCWPWVVSGHLPLESRVSSPEERVSTIWQRCPCCLPLQCCRLQGHLATRGASGQAMSKEGLAPEGPWSKRDPETGFWHLGRFFFFSPSNIGRGSVNTNLTWALLCGKKAWINPLSEWKIPLSYQLFFFFFFQWLFKSRQVIHIHCRKQMRNCRQEN